MKGRHKLCVGGVKVVGPNDFTFAFSQWFW